MPEPLVPISRAAESYTGQLVQWFVIGFGVLLLLFLMEAIRRGRLKERYALLWLGSAAGMIVFAGWRSMVDRIAAAIGVFYGPSLFFLMALLFLLVILLHFSLVISEYSDKTRRLTQHIALLGQEVERLSRNSEQATTHDPSP